MRVLHGVVDEAVGGCDVVGVVAAVDDCKLAGCHFEPKFVHVLKFWVLDVLSHLGGETFLVTKFAFVLVFQMVGRANDAIEAAIWHPSCFYHVIIAC